MENEGDDGSVDSLKRRRGEDGALHYQEEDQRPALEEEQLGKTRCIQERAEGRM